MTRYPASLSWLELDPRAHPQPRPISSRERAWGPRERLSTRAEQCSFISQEVDNSRKEGSGSLERQSHRCEGPFRCLTLP